MDLNKIVKTLLSKNNIVFVHGKPYNPHSQGIFERINQTVRNGLICAYLEMEKILIKMIH